MCMMLQDKTLLTAIFVCRKPRVRARPITVNEPNESLLHMTLKQ